jgi:aryl-phospho-beta-D-glucosidase BglC (GH1 family)
MKSRLYLAVAGAALLWLPNAHAQPATQTNSYRWWQNRSFTRKFTSQDAKKLPLIQVKGNQFVDAEGKTNLFRGVAISDPDKLEHQGHWSVALFQKVKEMGATLVRIPVHPAAWRERTPSAYLKLLDQAVEWSTELGKYVIIDWHSIGNLKMELFQDPMYNTTQKETFEFWRTIAQHFSGNNTVAFYELFNEPTTYKGQLGRISWGEWKKLNEDMISLIRAYDKETIPLIAGLDWAYDLTPILIEPIQAEGIAHVTHPYANKRPRPWEPKWEENFGFAAARYPVIATEFGFGLRKGGTVKEDDYGNVIINYLESKGISWVAWVFDPEWGPSLLTSWDDYQLSGAGEFFKRALQKKGQVAVKEHE